MIRVENLTKSFGGRVLLENVNITINSRERIGLVGRNGDGKTTFLRLLMNKESPDRGSIQVPKQYRIGHVRQQLKFTCDSIIEECIAHLPEAEKENLWQVEKILAGLGFEPEDMGRSPYEFSGGYQVRLNLAKVLLEAPDLLLLDEPTNYLDITAIRWIEGFLASWPRELLLVTHDRSFMDRVVTHTAGIHRYKVRKIEGETGKYYSQLAQDEEVYEKTRQNDERRRKEMELFISRFRAKARLANMVQSRVKTLSKLEKKDKLGKLKTLDFEFRSKPYKGKAVMHIRGLSSGYDPSRPLFSDLTASVLAGDRICVIGRNGRGKTTLLKTLGGELAPLTGSVTYNPGVEAGFFDQTLASRLDDSRTVEEEILYAHPDVDRQQARNICGAMMFSGDDALKTVKVISGGEKSRVMLGKLLVTPVNLLLLDEPTNHLDMESCDALLAAIDNYDGAVVMVTHNELFLHALAHRLIVFQDDKASVFEGTYHEFLDKDGWKEGELSPPAKGTASSEAGEVKLSKKEMRRRRSEVIAARSAVARPLEKNIKKIEDAIEGLETELATHTADMQTASQDGDGGRIQSLALNIHRCQSSIDQLFDELAVLTENLDQEIERFSGVLAELEGGLGIGG
jgi:ATP-binding cassette subfamily F protein 3